MGLYKVGTTIDKKFIAWIRTSASKSLLATKPVKINTAGLRLEPNLECDVVQINKIKVAKDKLTAVLQSDYCAMPDFMERIPKNASEEETVRLLLQLFEESKFFSRVSTCEEMYGKNFEFAKMMSELCKKSTQAIHDGKSFEEVLIQIAEGYSKETTINTKYLTRISESGRPRWKNIKPPEYIMDDIRCDTYGTLYGIEGEALHYKEYFERLNKNLHNRLSPYKNFTLTRGATSKDFCYPETMVHPYPENIQKNIEIISERYRIYQKLLNEYKTNGCLTLEQKKQSDNIISEIYYLIANTCPFQRGSNGITDVLMRSQYSALGINKPHIKKGIGLDLEAFCMNLDEYKLKWNDFFE